MIEIIPAIDLIEGKCVRLVQGDFSRSKIYCDTPLDAAKKFEAHGIKRLHIVDLDGAKSGKVTNLRVLESIASNTNLDIDFGGGIKTDTDIRAVFDAGAKLAGIGSVAVKNPEKFFSWLDRYGEDKILLGADVKNGKLAIDGWKTTTDLKIMKFLEDYFAKGVRNVFVTDVSKDGLLEGYAKGLYTKILDSLPDLRLIASGGVSSVKDITELEALGCSGAIIGKALYEDRISLAQLRSLKTSASRRKNVG